LALLLAALLGPVELLRAWWAAMMFFATKCNFEQIIPGLSEL